jgi:cysteinyl-tRNA synthetase
MWKIDPTHLMHWDSPWGVGYPGWHIECSVMARHYLGDTIDIHTGGEDNIFPHHESEIAQIEPVTGKPFVRTWVHARHLLMGKDKLSKSKGHDLSVGGLVEAGHDPLALRLFLLNASYGKQLEWAEGSLHAARENVERLRTFVRNMEAAGSGAEAATDADEAVAGRVTTLRAAVDAALGDNLNVPEAMAALHAFLTELNSMAPTGAAATRAAAAVREIDQVLGVLGEASGEDEADLAREVETLIQQRQAARAERDYTTADRIRDELAGRGIVLEDTPQGVRWHRRR